MHRRGRISRQTIKQESDPMTNKPESYVHETMAVINRAWRENRPSEIQPHLHRVVQKRQYKDAIRIFREGEAFRQVDYL